MPGRVFRTVFAWLAVVLAWHVPALAQQVCSCGRHHSAEPFHHHVHEHVSEEPFVIVDEGEAVCEMHSGGCGPRVCLNDDATGPLDNLSLFLGLEGSKQPQDFGVNAHLGGRMSANTAIALEEEFGLGLQFGSAFNYTDNAVQVFDRLGEASGRSSFYTTLGLFQRTDSGWLWAVAWDHLYAHYYDQFHLNQFRGRLGYAWDDRNEVGIRVAASNRADSGSVAGVPITLEPLSQGSLYLRHQWESGADTTVWAGVAESHGQRNLAFEALLGDPPAGTSGERFVFGAEIHVPLNDHVALFGQGNFITPAYTGTVDSYLGFAWYPGGGARRVRNNRFAPVMPVAGSTNMTLDLR